MNITKSCENCSCNDIKCMYCGFFAEEFDRNNDPIPRYCEKSKTKHCFFIKSGCELKQKNPEILWCEDWIH